MCSWTSYRFSVLSSLLLFLFPLYLNMCVPPLCCVCNPPSQCAALIVGILFFFQIIYVLLFSCWALFKRRPGELQLRHLCCEWKTLYCDDSCHFVILIHWLIWTMHDRIIVHNVCVVWQLPTQIISQLFTHCYLDLVAANESEHVLYV